MSTGQNSTSSNDKNSNTIDTDNKQRFVPPPISAGFPHLSTPQQQLPPSSSTATTNSGSTGIMSYGPSSSLTTGSGVAGTAASNSMNSHTGYRTTSKHAFTPDQDQIILQGKKMGKTWNDIAIEAGCDGPVIVVDRYNYLMLNGSNNNSNASSGSTNNNTNSNITPNNITNNTNNNTNTGGLTPTNGAPPNTSTPVADITYWDAEDIETLRDLLELGERAKWKYISTELTRERNKRIPAVACQKKFKDMFGVAEASSALGSSLCYVVSPNGWSCLGDSNSSRPVAPSSAVNSMYDYPQPPQQQQQQAQQPLQYQQQPHQGYGPLTTPSGFVVGNANKKPAITSPQGRPVDGTNAGRNDMIGR